ncbi:MAG: VWA domain-containing protein [Deltaproteobacteria bacterium]|nr:VWA domain-containing protein [Deltaproteobacteria bacterium]
MLSAIFSLLIAQTCQPPDALILLDVSGTMKEQTGSPAQTKFTRAKNAISTVLDNKQGELAFGLSVFPKPAEFNASNQLIPGTGRCSIPSPGKAVGFALNNKTPIMNALNAIGTPSGSNDTPIYQALVKAGEAATFPNDDRKRAIIAITDGRQDCCKGGDYDSENDCIGTTTTLDPTEAAENRDDVITLVQQMKSQGLFVYVVGFGDKVDPLMLGGMAKAAGTERDPACDPNAVSAASTNLCYFNVDAGNTQDFVVKLNEIVVQIQAEVCDNLDNDCNGLVDDGVTRTCGGQQCGGPGTETCTDGQWGACDVQLDPEVCDGVDNDCDGLTDEVPCTTTCGAGTKKCVNGKLSATCTLSKTPKEICNGRDDNCDGQTDEGCDCDQGEVQPCTVHTCNGMKVCAFGKFGECEADTKPEVCDGVDNDCDGKVDGAGLCADGSQCVQGKCTSGIGAEEIGGTVEEVTYVYRGQGVSRACNGSGSPDALVLLLLALPFLRSRRRRR